MPWNNWAHWNYEEEQIKKQQQPTKNNNVELKWYFNWKIVHEFVKSKNSLIDSGGLSTAPVQQVLRS